MKATALALLLLASSSSASSPVIWPDRAEKPKAGAARKTKRRPARRPPSPKPAPAQPPPAAVPGGEEPAPKPEPPRRGWRTTSSSLLLVDEKGVMLRELPVGRFSRELPDGVQNRRDLRGGVSGGGQFAWHWEKDEVVRSGRMETVLSSRTRLGYYGTGGQTLWESSAADAPPGLDPVLPSGDGETVLVFERPRGRWVVAGLTFSSKRLLEFDAADRVERAFITANGRFAMALWSAAGGTLMGTFLEFRTGARYEMKASEAPLARVSITEDGRVVADGKTLYKF